MLGTLNRTDFMLLKRLLIF